MEQAMNAMQAQMNAGFESMRAAFQSNMASGFVNYGPNTQMMQLSWGSGPTWQCSTVEGNMAPDAQQTYLANNTGFPADVTFRFSGQGSYHSHAGSMQTTVQPYSRVNIPTPNQGSVEIIITRQGATAPDSVVKHGIDQGLELVINQAPDGRLVAETPPPYSEK